MSAVTKCDICGEIYSVDHVTGRTFDIGITEYNPLSRIYECGNMDLCPDCAEKVYEFINVLKTGNRYVINQYGKYE